MTVHRFASLSRALLLCALPLAAAACTSNDTSSTPTTPTVTETVTETFSGVLSQNGAATYPFPVPAAGSISAALQTLARADGSGAAPAAIGIALGTWNGTVCNVILANDNAVQGSTVPGTAAQVGNFCLRVYDATGTVAQPESYVVTVTHPK